MKVFKKSSVLLIAMICLISSMSVFPYAYASEKLSDETLSESVNTLRSNRYYTQVVNGPESVQSFYTTKAQADSIAKTNALISYMLGQLPLLGGYLSVGSLYDIGYALYGLDGPGTTYFRHHIIYYYHVDRITGRKTLISRYLDISISQHNSSNHEVIRRHFKFSMK